MSTRDGTLTDGCGDLRIAVGAYVLGALSAADAEQVRAHLPICPECQHEYELMKELPALMGTVTPVEVEHGPPQAPAVTLDRAMRQVVGYHTKVRQRFRVGVAAAVAAAAVVGAVTYGLAGGASKDAGDQARTAVVPGTQTHQAINPANGTNVSVRVEPVNWGSELQITLRGVPPLSKCSLIAYGRDGSREVAASWTATYDAAVNVPGGVAMPAAQIDHFEVVTFDGKKIASIPG